MPVEVPKSASKVIVRRTAIDKHMAHNCNLPCTEEWQLVYPDFQKVDNIPGTNYFFTVEKYKVLESLMQESIYSFAEQKIFKVFIITFNSFVV